MSLVPSKTAGVEASTRFHLEHTTKGGLRFYVRPLNRGLADAIIIGSRDFKFLCGQGDDQYLLVLVRGGKILRGEPRPYGDLDNAEVIEILNFYTAKEPSSKPVT